MNGYVTGNHSHGIRHYFSSLKVRRKIGIWLFVCGCFLNLFSATLIPANNSNINYFGRFDVSTPAAPKFNWSGVGIEAAFPGPYIGFKLTDGNADYDVEIDGKLDTVIRTKSGVTQYTIATNLSEGSHVIRIIQRSENHWNAATFGGLYLADGKDLLAAPAKPKRKIEFIGDSYTVGYGNESPSRTCSSDQLRAYTTTNRSFPSLITKAFHAQSMILGWSGAGMVRNYGDSEKKSSDPYPTHYGKTLGAVDGGPDWAYSRWTPDVVVICLCTNDYSTTPHPDQTVFSDAYHAFIAKILGNYPDVPIFCVGTNTDTSNKVIKRIVTDETGKLGHSKVYLDSFPANLKMTGCDWHPTVGDDSAVAKVLIGSIMKKIGWDTATSTVIDGHKPLINKTGQSYFFRTTGKKAIVRGSTDIPAGTRFTVNNLKGRVVAEGLLDAGRSFVWNFSGTGGGVFIVGIEKMGWRTVAVR
jgi:hypothetical protein